MIQHRRKELNQYQSLLFIILIALCYNFATAQPKQNYYVTDYHATHWEEASKLKNPSRPRTWSYTKKVLRQLHSEVHPYTIYCACKFSSTPLSQINCPLPLKEGSTSHSISFDHVAPLSWFGKSLRAWEIGHPQCINSNGQAFKGRRCAWNVSAKLREIGTDLHNIFPSIESINHRKSDFRIDLSRPIQPMNKFSFCPFHVSNRQVQLPVSVRGEISRSLLYMHNRYKEFSILNKDEVKVFEEWSNKDRPDPWECKRNELIHTVQGNRNSFISVYC